MNPYAEQLGDQEPMAVITGTAGRLDAIYLKLGPAGLDRSYAPGKWTAREILIHLTDTELVFAVRLRHTLAEDHHMVQPFDQNAWAQHMAAYPADAALALFSAARKWNVLLIKSLPPGAFAKPVSHPERGLESFGEIVDMMAGHDINHLRQLDMIVAA
jgi:hypothetical protein